MREVNARAATRRPGRWTRCGLPVAAAAAAAVAATAATASAVAAAAAAAATTAATAVLGLGDAQAAAAEVLAVERGDRGASSLIIHLDEAEAAGTTGLPVVDQGHGIDGAVPREQLAN